MLNQNNILYKTTSERKISKSYFLLSWVYCEIIENKNHLKEMYCLIKSKSDDRFFS